MFKPSSTLPPVQFDANPSEYHKLGTQFPRGDKRRTMSRSELWDFSICPRRWLHGKEDNETSLMEHGSLVDCLFLTANRFERDYAVAPETYDKKGMKCPQCGSITDSQKCAKCKCPREEVTFQEPWNWNSNTCDQWRIEQEKEGKTVIKNDTAIKGHTAAARLREDEEIAEIRSASQTQVRICCDWHDKETGLIIPFKCLVDLMPDPASACGDTLWDLKTTNDATMKAWQRRVYYDGLHFQAGAYTLATNGAIKDAKYRQFGHIISESSAPFEPTIRTLTAEFLQLGENDFSAAMRRYCKCLAEGRFPGFDRDMVDMEIWMIRE